jgi:hypothetical protein
MDENALAERLIGAWHLRDWRTAYPDGRATRPFGSDASGLILYTADGWMNAAMWRRVRTSLSGAGSSHSVDMILREYLAYGGSWRIQGSAVVHQVTHAVNPILIGTEQIRVARFVDGDLILEAAEEQGGRSRLHTIEWCRELARR